MGALRARKVPPNEVVHQRNKIIITTVANWKTGEKHGLEECVPLHPAKRELLIKVSPGALIPGPFLIPRRGTLGAVVKFLDLLSYLCFADSSLDKCISLRGFWCANLWY